MFDDMIGESLALSIPIPETVDPRAAHPPATTLLPGISVIGYPGRRNRSTSDKRNVENRPPNNGVSHK